MDLSSTVGVTVQYDPPTSDTIHSLALCVHLDITPPEFTFMHKQVSFFYPAFSLYGIPLSGMAIIILCSKLINKPFAELAGGVLRELCVLKASCRLCLPSVCEHI